MNAVVKQKLCPDWKWKQPDWKLQDWKCCDWQNGMALLSHCKFLILLLKFPIRTFSNQNIFQSEHFPIRTFSNMNISNLNISNVQFVHSNLDTISNQKMIYLCTTGILIASFPSLAWFYLPFAFTIIHGSGRPVKNVLFSPVFCPCVLL